jgi:hypothetical protein
MPTSHQFVPWLELDMDVSKAESRRFEVEQIHQLTISSRILISLNRQVCEISRESIAQCNRTLEAVLETIKQSRSDARCGRDARMPQYYAVKCKTCGESLVLAQRTAADPDRSIAVSAVLSHPILCGCGAVSAGIK